MNGILIVNKEKGYTSFDVVAVMRKITGQKKIGHCGTLDPNAAGVLPLLLGNATKAQDLIINHDKEYIADFKLGIATDTLDIWGKVIAESNSCIKLNQLNEVLEKFKGEISQIPPMFSAISQNGQRLYDLARKGIEVHRESRKVTIYCLELIYFDEENQQGKIKVKCSKGTYIRSLIDDIGKMLGCNAVMTDLVRTCACGYSIDKALNLEEIKQLAQNELLENKLMSTESLFIVYKYVAVTESQANRFKNGGALDIYRTYLQNGCENGEIYRVKDKNGNFLGLGIVDKESSLLKIHKLF